MASIKRSAAEKKIDRYGYRREYHTEKTSRSFRFAGELFGIDEKKLKDRSASLQKSRPVGIGFGERDMYGPDESWETKSVLTYTPSPEYYTHQ